MAGIWHQPPAVRPLSSLAPSRRARTEAHPDPDGDPAPLARIDLDNGTHMLDALRSRLEDRTARVAVLWQGYVGLVMAMRASEAGFEVVGYEPDPARAEALAAGNSSIEDVPDEVLGVSYKPNVGDTRARVPLDAGGSVERL